MFLKMPKNKIELEYIGLDYSKQNYGKKHILYCEMELLRILKRIQNYKKLRKQEFALKRILKKDIKESYDALDRLGKILPEIKQDKFKPVKIHKTSKKRRDLEFEIEEIKRKISELH